MAIDLPVRGEEDRLLREAVRSLLAQYGRSYFLSCYRDGREPEALWRDLCQAGFVGAGVPERLGGGGSSLENVVAIGEELGSAGMPLLSFIMTELCLPVIARHAGAGVAARLIPPIVAGDRDHRARRRHQLLRDADDGAAQGPGLRRVRTQALDLLGRGRR
jgi:alkylation response protein AidB-like acyl-CoA dehydrogenase